MGYQREAHPARNARDQPCRQARLQAVGRDVYVDRRQSRRRDEYYRRGEYREKYYQDGQRQSYQGVHIRSSLGSWHSLGYHDLAAHRWRGEGRRQLARGGLVPGPELRAEDSRWGRGRGQCALGLLLRQPPHPLPVGTRRRGASPGWATLPGEL